MKRLLGLLRSELNDLDKGLDYQPIDFGWVGSLITALTYLFFFMLCFSQVLLGRRVRTGQSGLGLFSSERGLAGLDLSGTPFGALPVVTSARSNTAIVSPRPST
jgi:hypothetical protein